MLILFLTSCLSEPEAPVYVRLEDACGTSEFGYDTPSTEAQSALEQSNCYRNLVGLQPGVLHPALDEAAQSHADYMQARGQLTHQQSAGTSGYTGDWVWDRMEFAGYPLEAGRSWGEVVAYGYDPVAAVDGWVQSVYHRIPFTTPSWKEVGFGQAGLFSAMGIVTYWPAETDSAVIYPVDGQLDVPTTFQSDEEWPDPAPDHGAVGTPITVTVGSPNTTSSSDNPYDLELLEWQVSGPMGEVDAIVLTPNDDAYLGNTIALVPTDPLEPLADYAVEISISWTGGTATLTADFVTASEDAD